MKPTPTKPESAATPQAETPRQRPFVAPKLRFVQPKLTPRGDLCEGTGFVLVTS